MTSMMAQSAFNTRIMRGVNDPQKLLMTDFTFQCRQLTFQLLAKVFERGQKGITVSLQLRPDLLTLRRGGRVVELDSQQILLGEKFVAQ